MSDQPRTLLIRALESDDVAAIDALVREHPSLLNAPNVRPAITAAKSVTTAERLLSLGADVEAVGRWWARGMYTRQVVQEVGRLLVDRGASLTVHAAAGLGLMDRLGGMLATDPSLIDAKGGDGCTPLHFSRDVATAELLLEHGARLDARDEDHESTPAQWLVGDAPDVARFLLERGATPDIFLAAALGDRILAEELIDANRGCLTQRIGREPEFPPLGYKGRGGTIYGEGVDLAGAGPNKCLAIDYAGRSHDTLDDGGLFVIMQGARPDRFAGLRIDALSAVAHRAVEATIVDERLRSLKNTACSCLS